MVATTSAIRKFRLVLSAVLLISAAGCSATRHELIPMYWPEPPDKTRIKYVASYRSQDDFGRGFSFVELVAGQGPSLGLVQPMGLAVSEDDQRLYVSDFGQNAVKVFDFGAKTTRLIGNQGKVKAPIGVALDSQENVYISDTVSRSVKVFEKNGKFLREIGKKLIVRPTGIAVDNKRQQLYVVDTGHNDQRAHAIRVFDLEGNHIRDIGKRGDKEGEFNFPTDATVDAEGYLYVVDSVNGRIQVFDSEGKFLRMFGRAGDYVGDFGRPQGVALDSFGNIYVVDTQWSVVQMYNQKGQVLMHFAGRGWYPGLLFNPTGIAINSKNKIYVANTLGRRVDVYQLVNTTAGDSFEQANAGSNPAAVKGN